MKFIVVGVEAVGLRFGVLLREAGNEAGFIEDWQPHYGRMKEQGSVYIARGHQNRHLAPVNVCVPEGYTTTDVDFVLSELKQTQLDDMLQRCKCFSKDQYVLTAISRMGHAEKLLKYFPKEKLVAGTISVATILTGPGKAKSADKPRIGITNWVNHTEKPDAKTEELMAELKKTNFNLLLEDNFMGTLMIRAVSNSIVNTLCTMFEITMSKYANFDKADKLSRQLIDEAYDVCERASVQLVNTRAEELESIDCVSKVGDSYHCPSVYQDMGHNHPVEVNYINGYFVKLDRKYNYEAKAYASVANLVRLAEATRKKD